MTNLRSLLTEYLDALKGKPHDQWGNARDHAEECITPFVEWVESRAAEPTTRQAITEDLLRKADDSVPDPDPLF